MQKTRAPAILVVLAFSLALTPATGEDGGGQVGNVAPTATFVGDKGNAAPGEANTAPVTETFTLTVQDPNGEADLQGVKITSTYASFPSAEWTFTGTGACPTSPPSTWTCSDAVSGDGELRFTYTYTWPQAIAPGTYTQTSHVRDEGAYQVGPSEDTIFQDAPDVDFGGFVYDWDGTVIPENWGAWTATPGASNVYADNFLRAENTGTAPGTISINYNPPAFTRATGSETVPIDGNIQFCHRETSLTQVPESGAGASAFTCQSSSDADGAITYNVPASTRVWIYYRLAEIPSPLPDGSYTASFSATVI